MIHAIAEWVFSYVCHQEVARTWAPGGIPLALCQRCTGIYAGAALMLPLLPLMRFRPTRLMTALHAALIAQMVILGGHFVPHPAVVRTLSGQLFIAGVYYLVWTHLTARMGLTREYASPRAYGAGLAAALAVLPALVHAPYRWAAPLVEILSLIGVCGMLLVTALTLGDMALRTRRKRPHFPRSERVPKPPDPQTK